MLEEPWKLSSILGWKEKEVGESKHTIQISSRLCSFPELCCSIYFIMDVSEQDKLRYRSASEVSPNHFVKQAHDPHYWGDLPAPWAMALYLPTASQTLPDGKKSKQTTNESGSCRASLLAGNLQLGSYG